MKLFFRKLGQGQPLIILHGLFGQSDNWLTLGKKFAEQFEVYLVDQRNHGLSPHSNDWNYELMSQDLLELIVDMNLKNINLLGHSMGGKTAMYFSILNPQYISKLIVADIAPKYYPPHHQQILQGLKSIDFDTVKTRKEVEDQLSKYISDIGTKQFLLKNLYWKEEGRLAWRFNLDVIANNIETVGEKFELSNKTTLTPTLFLRGEKSNYILDADEEHIKTIFPNYILKTIPNAGHWLHADQPHVFYQELIDFVNN